MPRQPASLLPPRACAVAHPVVVTLFIETAAGDQLADAQDEQRHARPAGRSRSARVLRVAARDRDRARRALMDEPARTGGGERAANAPAEGPLGPGTPHTGATQRSVCVAAPVTASAAEPLRTAVILSRPCPCRA